MERKPMVLWASDMDGSASALGRELAEGWCVDSTHPIGTGGTLIQLARGSDIPVLPVVYSVTAVIALMPPAARQLRVEVRIVDGIVQARMYEPKLRDLIAGTLDYLPGIWHVIGTPGDSFEASVVNTALAKLSDR